MKSNCIFLFATFCIFICVFFTSVVDGLHFYVDNGERKCFQEELPLGSTVVGTYRTESINPKTSRWEEDKDDGLDILVQQKGSQHILLSQLGTYKGKFTFTSVEAGIHIICLSMNSTGGWFNSHRTRVYLDVMFGDPSSEQTSGKQKVLDNLVQRVVEQNLKVEEVKREQEYQRKREADFRDTSERVNSKIIHWTLIQLIVVGLTCLWQTRHLKGFFVKKKLV